MDFQVRTLLNRRGRAANSLAAHALKQQGGEKEGSAGKLRPYDLEVLMVARNGARRGKSRAELLRQDAAYGTCPDYEQHQRLIAFIAVFQAGSFSLRRNRITPGCSSKPFL